MSNTIKSLESGIEVAALSDNRVRTNEASPEVAIISDNRMRTNDLSVDVAIVAEAHSRPDGGGGAITLSNLALPFKFSVHGMTIDEKSAIVLVESDKISLYADSAWKSSVLLPRGITSTSVLHMIFYKNFVVLSMDNEDVGILWFETAEYPPDTFGIGSVLDGSAYAEIVEMPDYTMALFIETDNYPASAAQQLIGDRPIIVAPDYNGEIAAFVTTRNDAATTNINDALVMTRNKDRQVPMRAAVLSYSVFATRLDKPTMLGTSVIRMNADAIPVYYAKEAARRKFARQMSITVRNAGLRIGDTLSFSGITQADDVQHAYSGAVFEVTISGWEETYAIVE